MASQLHIADPMLSHEGQDVLGDVPSCVGVLISSPPFSMPVSFDVREYRKASLN